MTPTTRAELVRKLARRWRVGHVPARERIDAVLDEVLAVSVPRLEHEWAGSEVLQTLYRWRGLRP